MEKNVIYNSYGYRDQEYTEEKNSNTFRIYSLGDSYTFGWYLPNVKKTYTKLLEHYLNMHIKKDFEVINASSPGFSLKEEVERYTSEGKFFNPDLVTIGLNYGDFVTHGPLPSLPIPELPILKKSYVYRLTVGRMLKKIDSDMKYKYIMKIFTDHNSLDWKEFSNMILTLKYEAEKNNASLAIILFPHIESLTPNQPYSFVPMHKKVASFAKENNIYVIDPLKLFQDYPKKELLVINPTDSHPTELAHRFVFQAFVEIFDFNSYLATHKPFSPSSKTVLISSNSDSIGHFNIIKKISSTDGSSPWVYFEENIGNGIQTFSLRDISERQSNIYLDHLQTTKAFGTEGDIGPMIGASLEYHVLGKNYKNGQIIIPKKIYSFPVIGIENIVGFYTEKEGGNADEFIKPKITTKKADYIIIRFEKDHDYYELRLNLAVAVKQLNIKKDGAIGKIAKTVTLSQKLIKDTLVVTLPLDEKVSGVPTFTESPEINYNYAFVNNIFTKIEKVDVKNETTEITFSRKLYRGDVVDFPVFVSYTVDNSEILSIEIE